MKQVAVPKEELSELVELARELALAMDAESNATEEGLLEVRLLNAAERMKKHLDPKEEATE